MSQARRGRPPGVSELQAKKIYLRLSESVLARIDAHAARMREANPGLEITRIEAARNLIVVGLDAADIAASA